MASITKRGRQITNKQFSIRLLVIMLAIVGTAFVNLFIYESNQMNASNPAEIIQQTAETIPANGGEFIKKINL